MQVMDASSVQAQHAARVAQVRGRSLTRLECGDVDEVVDVEEDVHAGQAELQLPLDHRHLILPRAPYVAQKEVVDDPAREGQRGGCARRALEQASSGSAGASHELAHAEGDKAEHGDHREKEDEEEDAVAHAAKPELLAHASRSLARLEQQHAQEDEGERDVCHRGEKVVNWLLERLECPLPYQPAKGDE